jgi:ribose/xylose/arabinose/galactoside ABC-type transport system permease subunit
MTMTTSAISRLPVPQKYLPTVVTAALFVAVFVVGGIRYDGFASSQVVLNIFVDNAFLLVVAVGLTFVILTGGIDLSVGAVVALSTMVSASLVTHHGWPPLVAIAVVLVLGSVLGLAMGAIIHYFEIQPFIVTLAGMFLARACATPSARTRSPSPIRSSPPSRRRRSACSVSCGSRRVWSSLSRQCWWRPMCCTTPAWAGTSTQWAAVNSRHC